jgi:hypothetical protein
MNEDRIAGTARNMGGKVQEGFGRVTDDAKSQADVRSRLQLRWSRFVSAGLSVAWSMAPWRATWAASEAVSIV